uniref:Uncharacterized protein n=1 Tax=Phaeomonas parva TaxID=124430 RepID=A0A7S1UEP5_9STRA|mmetsp:Transcript_41358/g.129512  ORF Transcript_41358/g.129512 Transcript_41358/m.129512 type:complete len:196 (+) Transcript_41358:205-792(+)
MALCRTLAATLTLALVLSLALTPCRGFRPTPTPALRLRPSLRLGARRPQIGFGRRRRAAADGEKFALGGVNGFKERIETLKAGVVGLLASGVAVAVPGFFLDGSLPQWEFSTDMTSLVGFLFAAVYRYAVREDANPNLKQGVVGAFAITRIIAKINVDPSVCTAAPLTCGPPLGYYNWDMIAQGAAAGSRPRAQA